LPYQVHVNTVIAQSSQSISQSTSVGVYAHCVETDHCFEWRSFGQQHVTSFTQGSFFGHGPGAVCPAIIFGPVLGLANGRFKSHSFQAPQAMGFRDVDGYTPSVLIVEQTATLCFFNFIQ
jgi:hypothetical protein